MYEIAIIIILLLFIGYLLYKNHKKEFFSKQIISAYDNKPYKVIMKYGDHEEASYLISQINEFAMKLIHTLNNEYIARPKLHMPDHAKGKQITFSLLEKYNSKGLTENMPESTVNTSYTKNKGEEISLCLREKRSGNDNFHKLDDLLFVFIHELAHVVSIEISHKEEFWVNFKFLLEFCDKFGLYKSPNYSKKYEYYCGMEIKYNPRYDANLKSYFN